MHTFFQTGWCCEHVYAARGLIFGWHGDQMSTEIIARKRGRPRSVLGALSKEPANVSGPSSHTKLTNAYLKNPQRALQQKVLCQFLTNVDGDENAQVTYYPGTISTYTPLAQTWTAEFTDGETIELSVDELSRAIIRHQQ